MSGATNVGRAVVVGHVAVHNGLGPLCRLVRRAHLGVVYRHGPVPPFFLVTKVRFNRGASGERETNKKSGHITQTLMVNEDETVIETRQSTQRLN